MFAGLGMPGAMAGYSNPSAMQGYQVVGFLPIVVDPSGAQVDASGMAPWALNSYAQVQNPIPLGTPETFAQNRTQEPRQSQSMDQNMLNQDNRRSKAGGYNVAKGPRKDFSKAMKTQSPNAEVTKASRGVGRSSETAKVNQDNLQHQADDNQNLMGPLWKTKMCVFAPHGLCSRGDTCRFAHDESELREAPDFSKTSICPKLLRGEVCEDEKCPYAHRGDELREINGMLKTKICRFWSQMGRCVLGSRCRFAHGDCELGTVSPKPDAQGSATNETPSEDKHLIDIFNHLNNDSSDDSDSDNDDDGVSDATQQGTTNICQQCDGDEAPPTNVKEAAHPQVPVTRVPQMWSWQYAPTRTQATTDLNSDEVVMDGHDGHSQASTESFEAMPKCTNFYGVSPGNTPPITPRMMWTSPSEMASFTKFTVEEQDSNPPTPDPLTAWKRQQDTEEGINDAIKKSSQGLKKAPGKW